MNITSLVYPITGAEFSQFNWLVLIDSPKTRFDVARDKPNASL
jgi:hypothetical protein